MNNFKNHLKEYLRNNNYVYKLKELPACPKIEVISKKIIEKYPNLDLEDNNIDIDALIKKFKQDNWEVITQQDLINISWHIKDNFIDDDQFIVKYIDFCDKYKNVKMLKNICKLYIITFNLNPKFTKILSKRINIFLNVNELQNKKIVLKFLEINNLFKIFEYKEVIDHMSNMWEEKRSKDLFISDIIGIMHKNYYNSGLFSLLYEKICEKIKLWITQGNNQEFIQKLILDFINLTNKIKDFYPNIYLSVDSLLLPWNNNTPQHELQKIIQNFILSEFRDPRVDLYKHNWSKISEDSKIIFKKWLNKQYLELFIEVVNKTANLDHWESRKNFWQPYLDYCSDIWLVMAPEGDQYIKNCYNNMKLEYATFESGNYENNHAVIIMQIQNLIIADWSHNGRCRIWNINNSNKYPKLYKQQYHANSDLRNNDNSFYKNHQGEKWKEDIDKFIYEETSIKINRKKR